MKKTKLDVLVLGATGQQGGAVSRRLLERGHAVRGLTRKPNAPAAKALAKADATVVEGNAEDRSSLDRLMRRGDVVFAMSTPFEGGIGAEVRLPLASTAGATSRCRQRRTPSRAYARTPGCSAPDGGDAGFWTRKRRLLPPAPAPGENQVPAHRSPRYRCFLPDLAGFAGFYCRDETYLADAPPKIKRPSASLGDVPLPRAWKFGAHLAAVRRHTPPRRDE